MATETPTRRRSRLYASARAHDDAHPRRKKAAADNGVSVRTERRWRTPHDAQGSPPEAYARYLATAQDPERLEVFETVTKEQARLAALTNAELIAEIHELHARDPREEAEDTAARSSRGIPLRQRAVLCERDATTDMKLAARYREADARGLKEADIFDQWSPR